MEHRIDHTIDIDALAKELANGMSLEQLRERQGAAATKLTTGSIPPLSPVVPITEQGRTYIESLKRQAQPQQPIIRDLSQPMKYDVARRKVWALFE